MLVTQCGSLIIKLLRRTVSLEGRELLAGPPTAQSSKLSVPKKTKVFVEQTQREREYATGRYVCVVRIRNDLSKCDTGHCCNISL